MKNLDFNLLLLNKNDSIKTAMKVLNENSERVAYITDEEKKLTGAVSDGDIRRALLKGISIDEKIDGIMNATPKYLNEKDKEDNNRLKKLMLKYQIQSLPIVDDKMIVKDIVYWVNIFQNEENQVKSENKVFIVAGGKGSRLEPFTKILPKPLIPVGDKTIIEKIMDKFNEYGFSNFILSVNYKAEIMKLYFSDPEVKNGYNEVEFVEENMPMGTIGSLALAKDMEGMNDTFFISNCDIIINEDYNKILHFHQESNSIFTIVGCIKNSVIPYGVLKTNETGALEKIDEKPEYKHIINTGVYVAEPKIIDYLEEGKAIDINVLIEKLLEGKQKVSVYPIEEESWFDVGQWIEYERTKKYFEKI